MTRYASLARLRAALSSVLAIVACAEFPSAGRAQELSSWKVDADQATSAYFDAIERADESRRAALREAGAAWLRALETELATATKARDAGAVSALTTKIEAARRVGRAPLPRPDGVVEFQGRGYAFFEEGKPWHEAKAHCEAMGGRLLMIDSEAEEAFVLSKWAARDFFVGATDLYTPGEYLTLDGEPFRGFAAPFHADNALGWQNAVCWYAKDRDWNDHIDGLRLPYVCEWETAE